MGAEIQDRCIICGGLIYASSSLMGISKHPKDTDCRWEVGRLRNRLDKFEEAAQPKKTIDDFESIDDLKRIAIIFIRRKMGLEYS